MKNLIQRFGERLLRDDVRNLSQRLAEKRWVYALTLTEPDPSNETRPDQELRYRVALVIEGEEGYFPMGDKKKLQAPWYWDRATVEHVNAERGFTPLDAFKIVASSMTGRRRRRRNLQGEESPS